MRQGGRPTFRVQLEIRTPHGTTAWPSLYGNPVVTMRHGPCPCQTASKAKWNGRMVSHQAVHSATMTPMRTSKHEPLSNQPCAGLLLFARCHRDEWTRAPFCGASHEGRCERLLHSWKCVWKRCGPHPLENSPRTKTLFPLTAHQQRACRAIYEVVAWYHADLNEGAAAECKR